MPDALVAEGMARRGDRMSQKNEHPSYTVRYTGGIGFRKGLE